jgi:AcrR family transcriptional regulator
MTSTIAELFDPTGLGKSIDQADSPNYAVQKTLIKVATDHFVRFGYRKANIAEIALGAGIGKGTIYLHFENKKELFLSCLLAEDRELLPQLQIIESLPQEKRLRAFLEVMFNFALTSPLNRALLSRRQDFAALIEEIDTKILKDHDEKINEYIINKLISPLTHNLNAHDKKTITNAINLATLAIGYLPDMAFDLPGQQIHTDDFVKALAMIIDQGIKNT